MTALRHALRPAIRPAIRSALGVPLLQDIQLLFAKNEMALCINDPATMYQDSVGTTPVTATSDPVGLWIDQSLGGEGNLGPEKVTNGTFDSDVSGWTETVGAGASISWASGEIVITAGLAGGRAVQSYATTINTTYRVSVKYSGGTSADRRVRITNNSDGTAPDIVTLSPLPTAGVYEFVFTATSTLTTIALLNVGALGETAIFDNISVREIPGHHATQSTSAARALLQQSGGVYYLDYDGVDDLHTVTFASSLGSDCTVAYSIPGVGTTILTGQTIGTSHTIDVDNCGYCIIDRALSAYETTTLTAYLNSLAGL